MEFQKQVIKHRRKTKENSRMTVKRNFKITFVQQAQRESSSEQNRRKDYSTKAKLSNDLIHLTKCKIFFRGAFQFLWSIWDELLIQKNLVNGKAWVAAICQLVWKYFINNNNKHSYTKTYKLLTLAIPDCRGAWEKTLT